MIRKLCFLLVGSIGLISGGNANSAASQESRSPSSDNSTADLRPLEVRIRKMHLVRPDLLHYPMEYDVYC